MKYFNIQLEVDKAHDLFIHLSKLHHPDSSGADGKIFAEMKNEYEEYKILKKHEKYLFHYFSNMIKPKVVVKEIIKEVYVPNNDYNPIKANEFVQKVAQIDFDNIQSSLKEINILAKNVKKIFK